MISHKHKCIFVHLQRTAGTSIEKWLCGQDWWQVECNTKHLLASQARKLYADYWDDYFTFAIIRHPCDRLVSLAKFRDSGITQAEDGTLQLDRYAEALGTPPLEYDRRFWLRSALRSPQHQVGCLYGNVLDEPLDFVGRFELLRLSIERIAERIANPPSVIGFPHLERSTKRHGRRWPQFFDDAALRVVQTIHGNELEAWGYGTDRATRN